MPRNLQAVIFDFDGVLVDSEPLHHRACQQVFAPYGVVLDYAEYAARYIGVTDHRVFRLIADAHDLGLDDARIDELVAEKAAVLHDELAARCPLYPGVPNLLRAWSEHVPLAIASGSLPHEIDFVLRRAALREAVRVIVGASPAIRSKPAPDPYMEALGRLGEVVAGLSAGRVVAIEDSPSGLRSARAAGLRTVGVTTSYPRAALAGADLVADHVTLLVLDELDALCGH